MRSVLTGGSRPPFRWVYTEASTSRAVFLSGASGGFIPQWFLVSGGAWSLPTFKASRGQSYPHHSAPPPALRALVSAAPTRTTQGASPCVRVSGLAAFVLSAASSPLRHVMQRMYSSGGQGLWSGAVILPHSSHPDESREMLLKCRPSPCGPTIPLLGRRPEELKSGP